MNLEELKRKLESEGFTPEQIDEILLGIEADIHVGDYFRKEFSANQMREIRIGLQHGLYVADYADPGLSAEQMWIIRHAKESGLDTNSLSGSLDKMMAVFISLQSGVYTPQWQSFDADVIYELQNATKNGVDVESIPYKELDSLQIHELIKAIESDLNISTMLTKQSGGEYMSASKMFEVRKGLESGFNLIQECGDADYSASQLREIRFGLADKLNVAVYCNQDLSGAEMRQIRLGMYVGVDVSLYNEPRKYSAAMMRIIRQGLTEGIHPTAYLADSMTVEDAAAALQSIMNANENVHDRNGGIMLNQDYLNRMLG